LARPRVKVDLTHQEVRKGDILALCSTAVGQVKKDEIAAVATRERTCRPRATG